jgi:hypothetical protein
MARIRSVKPEFFKHGELQDLENANKGQFIMLVYAGLWTQCDKQGVFFYEARALHNEILPYIDFDIQKTLNILEEGGFFRKFSSGNRKYGYVPNFSKYQFPTKGERQSAAKYPSPPDNITNLPEDVLEDNPKAEGIRNKDKGIRNKDKGKDVFELLNREPKNDIEKVNKKWLENYISLHGEQPVNPSWNLSTPLVAKAIKQVGVDKILEALDTAKKDIFCLNSGYILKIIMSSNVISRLVNKPAKHRIKNDNVSPEDAEKYFKKA